MARSFSADSDFRCFCSLLSYGRICNAMLGLTCILVIVVAVFFDLSVMLFRFLVESSSAGDPGFWTESLKLSSM